MSKNISTTLRCSSGVDPVDFKIWYISGFLYVAFVFHNMRKSITLLENTVINPIELGNPQSTHIVPTKYPHTTRKVPAKYPQSTHKVPIKYPPI